MSIHVVISILILVVGLVLGMPIPFAFGGSFLYLTYTLHFNPSTLLASGYTQINSNILLASGYTQINSNILLAIPLFVLAGKIMEKGHMLNVPTAIANGLLSLTNNRYLILLMINIFMIIIGMLMDDTSGILLCTPILIPIVTGIGVHPVHFAAILGVNLGMGNITPPTAPMLYLSGRVCGAKINQMLSPIMTFIIFAWIPTLLITTYVPAVATFLPRHLLPNLFGVG